MSGFLITPKVILKMTVFSRPFSFFPISSMIVKSGTIISPCVPIIINKGTTAFSPKASNIIGIPSRTVFEKLHEKALITCCEKVRFHNKCDKHILDNKTINVPI